MFVPCLLEIYNFDVTINIRLYKCMQTARYRDRKPEKVFHGRNSCFLFTAEHNFCVDLIPFSAQRYAIYYALCSVHELFRKAEFGLLRFFVLNFEIASSSFAFNT